MQTLLEQGQTILFQQPFSHFLGTQLIRLDPGYAELSLAVQDVLKQQNDLVHNGVISYMADNALNFAVSSIFGESVTTEYKINFLRPAQGDFIVSRATAYYDKNNSGKKVICNCDVHLIRNQSEVLCATAQGIIDPMNKIAASNNPWLAANTNSSADANNFNLAING